VKKIPQGLRVVGAMFRLRLGRLGLGQRCYAQTPKPPYWAVIFTSERTANSKAEGLGMAGGCQ